MVDDVRILFSWEATKRADDEGELVVVVVRAKNDDDRDEGVKASEECTAITEAKMAIIDTTDIMMLFAVWFNMTVNSRSGRQTWTVGLRILPRGVCGGELKKRIRRERRKIEETQYKLPNYHKMG